MHDDPRVAELVTLTRRIADCEALLAIARARRAHIMADLREAGMTATDVARHAGVTGSYVTRAVRRARAVREGNP